MLKFYEDSTYSLIGKIVEFKKYTTTRTLTILCERVNNSPVRPDEVVLDITKYQMNQIANRFSEGDFIMATIQGPSDKDKQNIKAKNFAYLLDLKLLNHRN